MKTVLATALLLLATHCYADDTALVAETKKTALEIPPKLLAMLQDEIGKGSFDGAIAACREKAPKMAAAASQATGWEIRRVSLKNRNPKAIPDDWERAALEDFDRRAATGESPATLEKAEIVGADGKRTLRFMKALPTQQLCLSCHGKQDQLAPEVKARLSEIYPNDQATGYSEGQIRGALTVKRPL
ncbi:MAG: DUF3365 domain-containing protein [Rhodocyclaceae bacterium]|nr:MAG: DUF3365 domain-containing protein [Rhodocyclaceae bacterium]